MQLCATYLLHRGEGSEPTRDSVARFHLNDGAELDRINWLADSRRRASASRSASWSISVRA